jgi:four helix bundle protein
MLNSYQDLRVWQVSMDLAEAIYKLTAIFPPDERFGMVSQMRRAAVSIPSNIAEGYRRIGLAERIKFVGYAYGSASELETQLNISKRLGFYNKDNQAAQEAEKYITYSLRLINLYNRSLKEKQRG